MNEAPDCQAQLKQAGELIIIKDFSLPNDQSAEISQRGEDDSPSLLLYGVRVRGPGTV